MSAAETTGRKPSTTTPGAPAGPSGTDLLDFATAIHGDGQGYLALFSGLRVPGTRDLQDPRSAYFRYPDEIPAAAAWLREQATAGREAYAAAHLVRERSRRKEAAAPVRSLWSDVDHCRIPETVLRPSLVVASSPGRWQAYWRLTRPIEPARAEMLNKRLAVALGADPSGSDLSQLLRVPGTVNFKYPGRPTVELVACDGSLAHDPDELDRALPPLPTEKKRSERAAADAGEACGDMPPVVLDAEGMATWRGERPKVKADGSGEIDRSASLPKIGRILYDAGATRPTIERALAERDEALGWRKYADRRDAAAQYAKIVDLLEAEGRTPRRPTIVVGPRRSDASGDPGAGDLPDDPATLKIIVLDERRARLAAERERDEVKAENQRLRDENAAIIGVATNPHIKAEAVTALRVVTDIAHRRGKGERPDPDGFWRVRPQALGEDYAPLGDAPPLAPIRGKSTINRHLHNLDAAGLIERDARSTVVEMVVRDPETKRPVVDPTTGRPKRQKVTTEQTWVKVTGESILEMLDPFRRYRRPATADDAGDDRPKTHGGKREKKERPVCPHCGGTHVACTECGATFDLVDAGTKGHDETRPPQQPSADAGGTAFQDEPVKNDTPPGSGTDTTAFQDEPRSDPAWSPTAETVVGAAWLQGQAFPGFATAPPDPYTDPTFGRRR